MIPKKFNTQIDKNLYQNISLNLTIPIFNNGKNNLYIQQAVINTKEAILNRKIAETDFWNKINKLKIDISNTENELRSTDIALKLALLEKENTLILHQNGRVKNYELQESIANLFIAKSNLIPLKYQLFFKKLLLRIYSE